MTMNLVGTAMLWVGWFGFQWRQCLGWRMGRAAMAGRGHSQISAQRCGADVGFLSNGSKTGKPSALGFVLPGGHRRPMRPLLQPRAQWGAARRFCHSACGSGVVAYWAATWLKRTCGVRRCTRRGREFTVSGAAWSGILLVSFFASTTLGGTVEGLNMGKQFGIQAFAGIGAAVYHLYRPRLSFSRSFDLVSGLRVDEETEDQMRPRRGASTAKSGYDL